MRLLTVILGLAFAGPVFAGATGRIEAPDGAPIAGAQVCEQIPGSPDHCVATDAQGYYRMDDALRTSVTIRARGFLPQKVDAVPLNVPVRLQRAAILLVNVFDAAAGTAVASGRVMIDTPSGRRLGDFVPFNKAGVRISTLEPGDVFVRVEAEGYQPSGPVPVDLVSGVERTITVRLLKAKKPPSP